MTDPDEFLPPETWKWCRAKLHELGLDQDLIETQTRQNRQRLQIEAYLKLVDAVELHIAALAIPELGELPPPVNYNVSLSEQSRQAMERSGEAVLDGRPVRLE